MPGERWDQIGLCTSLQTAEMKQKSYAKAAMTETFETGSSVAASNCRVYNFIDSEGETQGKAPRQKGSLQCKLAPQTLLALAIYV